MAKINKNTQYYHGYKFRIYPTDEQKEFIEKCINTARFVYNWAIDQEEKQYQKLVNGEVDKKDGFLRLYDLAKRFTEFRNLDENSWLLQFPVGICREAMINCIRAYKNWYNKYCHKPHFKSKKTAKPVCHPRADRMYIKGNMLQIEGLSKDLIKIDNRILEYDFSNAHFTNQNISRDTLGNYYISFSIVKDKPLSYFEDNNIPKMDRAIGIDLNFRRDSRVVCSDGTRFVGPDISKEEKKIKRLQSKMTEDINRRKEQERINPDKKIEPSKRAQKRQYEYRKYNKRIHDKNVTFAFTVAKRIVEKNPLAIVMENLDIKSMRSRHYIAKYIKYNPLFVIRHSIQNKCNMYNIPFILAPRTYESSQICSNCGHEKNIGGYHTFTCPNCGMRMDRDENAALNLEHLAYNYDFTHTSNINLANIS